ncbi:MAG: hypothetical protein EBQ80_03180 [Proteobacteria bacterium]|nr:hypothetical protein [Pseudomonadota bacterium]
MLTSINRLAVADVAKREDKRTEETHAPAKVDAVQAAVAGDNQHGNGKQPRQRAKNYEDVDARFEPVHDVDKIV